MVNKRNESKSGVNTLKPKLLSLAIAQALAFQAAHAATIEVNSTGDVSTATDTTCTLREAIDTINAGFILENGCFPNESINALGTNDAISFGAGVAGNTIDTTQGQLSVTKSVTINDGGENTTIDGNQVSRVMYVGAGATVTLNQLTITGGLVATDGGGVASSGGTVNLNDCTVTGNTTTGVTIATPRIDGGGGLSLTNGASMHLNNTTVSNNVSARFSGGIHAIRSNTLTLNNSVVSGNVKNGITNFLTPTLIENSVISDNVSTSNAGGGIYSNYSRTVVRESLISGNYASSGGGVFAISATVDLYNSTVSGNTAKYLGGGLRVANNPGAISLTNSTVTGNTAVTGNALNRAGGGVYVASGRVLSSRNSIIADNVATVSPLNADCSVFGTLFAGADNIATTACGGATVVADAKLGPLQDNGGPTHTHALLDGSPAIDAPTANNAVCETTDQRGFLRFDGSCDIGAFEVGALDLTGEPVTLKNNRWTMVGLSKDAPSKTVEDVFGTTTPTGLASTDYNINWVVYKRDESTDSYVMMALSDTLEQGKGYWVLQRTGVDLEFIPDGADTPVDTADPNCPSNLGCFEIDLVEGDGKFNLISHPFTNDVNWKNIRIVVNGNQVCDPEQAQNQLLLTDTFWNYDAGYTALSTGSPMDVAVFEAYKGYWVQTLNNSEGQDVTLLIPKGPVSDSPACVASPIAPPAAASIETEADEESSLIAEIFTKARAVFRRSTDVSNYSIPSVASLFSKMNVETGLKKDPSTTAGMTESTLDDMPWWLSWINVAEAAQDTSLKYGEWWVRLQAESDEDGGMVDKHNYLGWYSDSQDGKDRRDLKELPPFSNPYLTIVFPQDGWGTDSGDYASDLRKRKYWRKGEEWEFIVKSDKIGREVTLSWEGNYKTRRFWRMRLVDVESGRTVSVLSRGQLQTYTFTTLSTEHRFKWVYLARPK